MIAMRRLMIGGWGVEAGLRVRVIHPAPSALATSTHTSTAERVDAGQRARREAERDRTAAEIRWWTHGGR